MTRANKLFRKILLACGCFFIVACGPSKKTGPTPEEAQETEPKAQNPDLNCVQNSVQLSEFVESEVSTFVGRAASAAFHCRVTEETIDLLASEPK